MATLFENLFPDGIPAAIQALLLRDAMALFEEHWTAADGVKVPVFAHDAVNLLRRTTAGWRDDHARTHAFAALAAELQTKVAALEAKLANPTPKDSANYMSKVIIAAEDPSKKLHTPPGLAL